MEIEVVNSENDMYEIKMNNITIAELLRVYLNEHGIKFAAWRKEHPEKPIVFRIESSGKSVKKSISEAIVAIKKDLDLVTKIIKK